MSDAPVIDLKIQIPGDRVPPLLMAVLLKGQGKWDFTELVKAANDSGMIVTIVIAQPGSNA